MMYFGSSIYFNKASDTKKEEEELLALSQVHNNLNTYSITCAAV